MNFDDERTIHAMWQRLRTGYSPELVADAEAHHALPFMLTSLLSMLDRLRTQLRRLAAVTPQDRILILALWESGPRTVGELGALIDVSKSTISEMIDRLVARGLVARSEDPSDGRRIVVSLTSDAFAEFESGYVESMGYLATTFSQQMPAPRLQQLREGLAQTHDVLEGAIARLQQLDDNELGELFRESRERHENLSR